MDKITWTLSATFINNTPLYGLEPMQAAMSGDESALNRIFANVARGAIPMSGALGVVSSAITSSQKDLQSDIVKYIQNKTPIASSFLPEEIDLWTGEALNDIDNPVLRILNALSPIKVNGTQEPWRQWLLDTGWDGYSRLTKHSSGAYTYSETEREQIYKYIGDMQLHKQLERLMKSKKYNDQVGKLRSHRVTGQDLENDRIQLKTKYLPLYKEIDRIIKNAQKLAEKQLEEDIPSIPRTVQYQQNVDQSMKRGDVDQANQLQRKELETRKLLQFGGSQ